MEHRFLHILPDEKVVNDFMDCMEEVYPGESQYVVYNSSDILHRVKRTTNLIHYNINSPEFAWFLQNVGKYEKVCLHSIDAHHVFLNLNHSCLVWILWGADLYELLLRPLGYRIYLNNKELYQVRRHRLPFFVYRLHDKIIFAKYKKQTLKIVKKIKYVVGLRQDFELLKQYYPSLMCSYLCNFNYYPLEKLINKSNVNLFCTGKSVWVNNAAALNGNHVSIFKILSEFDKKIDVICPLSYGLPKVSKYIESKGYEYLGERFHPLKQFMQPSSYFNLFLDSNSFVFGHLRQCAFGNVALALYHGGKCFFYPENPLYQYLIELGAVVYNMKELTYQNAIIPLEEKYRIINRQIAKSICSKNTMLNQIKYIFNNRI